MTRRYLTITGSNRSHGIGLAVLKHFYEEGWDVTGTYRDPTNSQALLELARKEDNVHALKLDVTSDESAKKFKNKLEKLIPHLDVLINNAGMPASPGTIMTAPISQLEEQMQVHAIGAVRMTQALLLLLRKAENAVVVNVSSMLGIINGIGSSWNHYAPSKTALNALTLQMAATLRSERICVFAVHPGWVATDIGGYGAPVSPERSAKGLYKVITAATMRDSGTFKDYTGSEMSW